MEQRKQPETPKEPFVPEGDRPEVKLDLNQPVTELRVRDLIGILGQAQFKKVEIKDTLKERIKDWKDKPEWKDFKDSKHEWKDKWEWKDFKDHKPEFKEHKPEKLEFDVIKQFPDN